MEHDIQNIRLDILREYLFDTPESSLLSKRDFDVLDKILTKLLQESNSQNREELRKILKIWQARTLFVDALQEEKDKIQKDEE